MSQRKWLGAIIVIALSGSTAAYAIEGGGGGDRDTSRGANWRSDDRAPSEYYRGSDYQNREMRARHQRLRDDDAERYSTDFDVQSRMNN